MDNAIKNLCLFHFREEINQAFLNGEKENVLEQIILKYIDEYRKSENKSNIQEEPEECSICYGEMDNCYTIPGCGHKFCFECVQDTVKQALQDNQVEVHCPEAGCTSKIPTSELYAKFFTPEMCNRFTENSRRVFLSAQKNCKFCPKCEAGLLMTDNKVKAQCPICKSYFCTNCLCEYHDGYTCEQYQKWKAENDNADEMFREFIKTHGECPECHMVCERISGCNYIKCICGCGYCYKCHKKVKHFSPHILQANCSLSGEGHD
ncbi:zinc finger protein putative [Entamoeba histolytica]|uniref:Zinc finger protein putative n=1 Tax=Entamoeba histolytica TaxID=5759 RepID=A0A175JKA9_ENTHI|nr:zinc finger protein putative [Entamoeba histolytica]